MKKNNFQKGLTLVELVVAMGIFVLIVSTVSGIFVSSLRSQNENIAFQEIQDNGRYILEMIMREIRMSKITTDFGEYDNLSVIRNDTGDSIIYFLDNSQIFRQLESEAPLPVNSEKVKVNHLKFYISLLSEEYEYSGYHRVTIAMELESQIDPTSKMNLQTTITSRPPPPPTAVCAGQ